MLQVTTLFTGIVAARALGVDGRGDLALLWITPLALVVLGSVGLPQATAYFTAQAATKDAQKAVISTASTAAAPISLGLTILYLTATLVFTTDGSELRTAALVNAPLVTLFLFQAIGVTSLQGLQDFGLFNITRALPFALYASAAILLFALGRATLVGLVAASVFGFAVATLFTWHKVRVRLNGIGSERVPKRQLFSFGFRGVLADVNPLEEARLDQLIVGFLIDPRALGLYVSAASFSNLPSFIATSLGSVAMPRIAAADQLEAQWAQARKATAITAILVALVVGVLQLLLPALIEFLFGPDFLGAVPIGRILVLAGAALAMKRLLTNLAKGLGRPGYASLAELVNLLGFVGTLGLMVALGDVTAQTVALSVLAGAGISFLFLGTALLRVRILRLDTGLNR